MSERRSRIEKLREIRGRIDAELGAIEDEIAAEIAATGRARDIALQAGVRIPRRPAALCGTEGGYYRHRRTLREDACDACKLAHKVAEAARAARRKNSTVTLVHNREAS